jgi:hypothetical protein
MTHSILLTASPITQFNLQDLLYYNVEETLAMTTEKFHKAWPSKQYGGNPDDYQEYETDKDAWLIDNNTYEAHLELPDPKLTPRVLAAYNDDNGQAIAAEQPAAYNRRLRLDAELGKKIWAKGIRGFTGEARRIALTMPKHDARLMFLAIKTEYGDHSNKQVTHIVREFSSRSKSPNKPITTYNAEWREAIRIMHKNKMILPESYLVNLYLISLGTQYAVLENMVAVMPQATRTLAHVMKLALDHHAPRPLSNYIEPDTSDVALSAAISTLASNGYTIRKPGQCREQAQSATEQTNHSLPCSICSHPHHCSAECFRKGGGLQNMNQKERSAWIEMKRKKRSLATMTTVTKPPTEFDAALSAMQNNDLQKQMDTREAALNIDIHNQLEEIKRLKDTIATDDINNDGTYVPFAK